jgi:hypothetical protein
MTTMTAVNPAITSAVQSTVKTAKVAVLVFVCWLASCSSTPTPTPPAQKAVRAYNGTASVGDFLTISVDSIAQTITYKDYTNGETGTAPYTINADGSYTIIDPNANLLSAYEVPGTALMIEAANAGPLQNTDALITAIESTPATINTFAGKNFSYLQFRTAAGGLELGTVTINPQGDITHDGYWPFGALQQPPHMFGGGSFPASSVQEDASGNFFTINESGGQSDMVFGTQNGLFAVDTGNGTILALPKAPSKNFSAASAGTYTGLFYEKVNAQTGQGNIETGTAVEGKVTVTISASGAVTIADGQGNTLGGGTLVPVADTSYIYDGTSNKLSDPLNGVFTFRTTANSQQDVFVSFQGNAVVFASFQTALPIVNYAPYTYFYGVGLK